MDAITIKRKRMNAWLDAVQKNLAEFEEAILDLDTTDFARARSELLEQYRLIKLMKNVLDGKTKLDGYVE